MILNTSRIWAFALILLFVFAGCQSQEEIVLGAVIPQTGDLAFLGDDYQQSLELAVEEINAEGNIRVKLIVEDGRADPKTSLTAAQALVNVQEADAIFTAFRGASMAISSAMHGQDVTVLANTATSQNALIGKQHFFPIGSEMVSAGRIVGEHIDENNLCESLALISENTDAGKDKLAGVREGFSNIHSEQYIDSTDYRTVLLKAQGADCIFFELRNTDTPIFLKQMQELGMEQKLFANAYAVTQETITQSPENIQGLIFSSNRFSTETNSRAEHYIMTYRERYGEEPNEFGAALYDAAHLFAAAAERCEVFSTECVNQEIRELEAWTGVLGQETITQAGDIFLDDYILKEVDGDGFSTIS